MFPRTADVTCTDSSSAAMARTSSASLVTPRGGDSAMKLFKMSRLDTILLSDPAIIGAPSKSHSIQQNTMCVYESGSLQQLNCPKM